MADRSGKTEKPTDRRVQKARREGQFPAAREFVAALQFVALLALVGAGGAHWFAAFGQSTRRLFVMAFGGEFSAQFLSRLVWQLFWKHFMPLALAGTGIVVLTLGLRLATTRFGVSLKRLAPDLKRFSPVSRLRELPRQNLAALAEAAVLLPLFLYSVYAIARGRLESFLLLPLQNAASGARFLGTSLMDLFWKAAGLFVVFGAVDLFRQMRR